MTNRIRNASAALLFFVCLVALTSAFNLPNKSSDLSSRLVSLGIAAMMAMGAVVLIGVQQLRRRRKKA
jgi:cell division protein FtsW (lipid II flippase)